MPPCSYLLRSRLDDFSGSGARMVRFRIGALVVWRNQIVPIANRWAYPDGTLYLLHTHAPDGALVTDAQVTFGQLVSEMNSYARYCVGDKVNLGPWDRYIKARWWNCRRGTVLYRINDFMDEGRNRVVLEQEELVRRAAELAG